MGDNESIKSYIRLLCSAVSTEKELEALRLLSLHLAKTHTTHCDPDAIEQEFLTQSKTVLEEGNPFPSFEVTELIFPSSNTLADFVNYVFTRRYGWSEVVPTGEQTLSVQRIHGVGSSSKNEGVMKSQLNELLDDLLKWMLCQKLSHELISSLQHAVKTAANHPVIRKQMFIHILEWFRSTCTVFHEEYFESSKSLFILGLTDVWSAIRSACASKLNAIAEQFSIKQTENFFKYLVQICRDSGCSWQAKEGAVMGLNVIVRRFQWVASSGGDEAQLSNSQPYMKFGKEEMEGLPEFIRSQLHDVVFILLADPQLSIREHAIKTFSSYLSRCELQEAYGSFREVISALCRGTGISEQSVAASKDLRQLLALPDYKWMDAYMSEGLLGLCIFLVKNIAPDSLLPDWSLCMNIFSLYLMHPASTVRQATSKVIKFLVAKDTSNPTILKLVLSSLSANWSVDSSLLSETCLPENYASLPAIVQVYTNAKHTVNPSIKASRMTPDATGDLDQYSKISASWEWREGRLLAYELVFQFLIKNHWLYTFGASVNLKSQLNSMSEDSKSGTHESLKPQKSYGGSSMQNVKSDPQNIKYDRSLNLREIATPPPLLPHFRHVDAANNMYDSLPDYSDLQRSSQAAKPDSPRDNVVGLRPRFLVHGGHLSPQLRRHHPTSNGKVKSGAVKCKVSFSSSPPRQRKVLVCPDRPSRPQLGMSRPRMSLVRRATMGYITPGNKPQVTSSKHHSYYYERTSKSPHKYVADGFQRLHTLPLITAVKRFEKTQKSSAANDEQPIIPTLVLSDFSSSSNVPNGDNNCQCADSQLKSTENKSMSELLVCILHQTIECVNSDSWELRRMSQQVLPCLVEIMRWYDMTLLVSFWSDHLIPQTSVISYGAALSFLYSVTHAAKLSPLLLDPPDSWQDVEACKAEVRKVVDCMMAQLIHYIPVFIDILKRPTLDRLSVIALQVLLTASSITCDQESNTKLCNVGLSETVDGMKLITVISNPNSRIQKYLPATSSKLLLLPGSGFLSCNPLDSDQLSVTTHHLQKHMLEHIHSLIVSWVRLREITHTHTLLPCLVRFIRGQYSTAHVNRVFTESVLVVLEKLSALITPSAAEAIDMDFRKRIYECKNDSFYELIQCVIDKTSDKHVVHMALECLASLLSHIDSSRYMLPVMKSICSQLCNTQGSQSVKMWTGDDNLEILSNDIRESAEATPTDDSESDDEESVLLEVDHQESLALQNSGGTVTSGRQSGMSQHSAEAGGRVSHQSDNAADSDSDWDSWDEDEPEASDNETVYGEFLQKVYQTMQQQGRLEEFMAALKKLSVSEYRLIKSLVKI